MNSKQNPPKITVGSCTGKSVDVRKANTSPSQAKMSMANKPTKNRNK